jgi:hypothetical protein
MVRLQHKAGLLEGAQDILRPHLIDRT